MQSDPKVEVVRNIFEERKKKKKNVEPPQHSGKEKKKKKKKKVLIMTIIKAESCCPHPDVGRALKTYLGRNAVSETYLTRIGEDTFVAKTYGVARAAAPTEATPLDILKEWEDKRISVHLHLTPVKVTATICSISVLARLAQTNLRSFLKPQFERKVDALGTVKMELPTMDWKRRIICGMHICKGMIHLHDHGVNHGFLKPSKVLLDNDRWIITDFLSTRNSSVGSQFSSAQKNSSSAAYTQGSKATNVFKNDVFSFGIILKELILLVKVDPMETASGKKLEDFLGTIPKAHGTPEGWFDLVRDCINVTDDSNLDFRIVLTRLETIMETQALS